MSAHAVETFQSQDTIRAAARQFIEIQPRAPSTALEVEVGSLDPRLLLPACDKSLKAFLPSGSSRAGQTTVGVRCEGSRPWSLYVPVRVRTYGPVLVAARPLPSGTKLQETDLRLETRDMGNLTAGYLTETHEALGKLTSRPLPAGAPIGPGHIKGPPLVRRGDKVLVLAETGDLKVRMSGEALMDGREGETVRIRNPLTKNVIHGVVAGSGVVRVPL